MHRLRWSRWFWRMIVYCWLSFHDHQIPVLLIGVPLVVGVQTQSVCIVNLRMTLNSRTLSSLENCYYGFSMLNSGVTSQDFSSFLGALMQRLTLHIHVQDSLQNLRQKWLEIAAISCRRFMIIITVIIIHLPEFPCGNHVPHQRWTLFSKTWSG